MRFAAYAGTSMALATGVIFRALHSRANFYSACVYLSQSNACLMILSNLLLLVVGSLLLGLQRLLYGPLRPIEIEQLYEKAWFAVTETCLAMTIFRDEVGAWFVVMFVSLLVGKVWGWIGEGRVEILEQQPPANPRLFHARLSVSLAASLLFDAYLLKYSISTVQKQARPNMMVMFAFEFAVLIVNSLSTSLRYAISLREAAIVQEQTSVRLQQRRQDILRQREEAARIAVEAGEQPPEETPIEEVVDEADIDAPGWEEKSRWVFYLDLATDFVKLFLYLTFFCVLCMFYGMPIHIIRDVALTIRSFYKRITDFLKYRHATRDMNERYPDATEDEIRSQDVCIICREAMIAWPANSVTEAANPVDERLRPKKLPCGHTLHFACLRSWLERQQNCPTCRQPVLVSNPQSPNALRAPNQANNDHAGALPGGERGNNNIHNNNNNGQRPVQHNRVRFFNLGPIRLGFGAGHDLRGLEQQFENRPALHPNARNNNENVHQFGLSLGLGRPHRQAFAAAGAGQVSLPNIQAQLQTFEQQLLQDINSLQLQNEQLQVVRQLQGELARLRIAAANHNTSRVINEATLGQTPQQPSPNLFGTIPQPQLLMSASGTNAPGSRDSSLPPGVAIPEGWTLLPLQPISESHDHSPMAQGSGLPDLNRTRSITPMTYPPNNRSAVAPPHQGRDTSSRPARSVEPSSENVGPNPDGPHSHSPRSRQGDENLRSETIPQWSFRPTSSGQSPPTEGTQTHDAGARSTFPGDNIEGENTDKKAKGKATTVEDVEDSE